MTRTRASAKAAAAHPTARVTYLPTRTRRETRAKPGQSAYHGT